ncbi:MAG: elongation factor Ts [Bacteroidales bacterium]|nr:elongation factor Ts [Bacteroidales bacterium]
MANITASDVNKLRQQTGAGMMDCKKALVEADGDFEKAVEILRKKGQKVASNRADRDAKEGVVLSKVNASATLGAAIMFNCETDFVAKNQEVVDFAYSILNIAIEKKPASLEALLALDFNGLSLNENITNMIGKTGEKLEVTHYEFIEAPKVFAYIHPGNRLATLVGLNKAEGVDEVGKDIAMQVAAMAPIALDKDDVDPSVVEKEIEIGKEQARQEGKPEDMLEKIAIGKLNKFYKESTLLNQEFIKDGKKNVLQVLQQVDKNLTVTAFKRLILGSR